jgi:WD40 repeat protein
MHIYHSALSWTPTSSPTRRLYGGELTTKTKLVNAVGPTWDACIRIIPVAVDESVKAVVFSPSGALIAAHGECCVKVFDAMTGVNRATFDGHKSISSVAFSPDDGFLVSGPLGFGGTINVCDVQAGTMFRTFEGNSPALSVAFSSCGTMVASGNADSTVRIWNILSGGCDCIFRGHSRIVTDVCWLETWNQVVSASDDDTVRIWDVRKQTCLKIFAHYHDRVTALAFSRGLLLVASKNGTANIYDSQSGDIIHVIRSNNMTHSRFSIDGGKVLVARRNSGDIWDITTKTLTRVGSIDYNGDHATFSPDGTRVASIYGKSLKIWKTNAGYNHHEASTHVHDTINDVYISSDERLVTLKSKKGANILDATTG